MISCGLYIRNVYQICVISCGFVVSGFRRSRTETTKHTKCGCVLNPFHVSVLSSCRLVWVRGSSSSAPRNWDHEPTRNLTNFARRFQTYNPHGVTRKRCEPEDSTISEIPIPKSQTYFFSDAANNSARYFSHSAAIVWLP